MPRGKGGYRTRRIAKLQKTAPPGAHFIGFGGSSIRQETLVFDIDHQEYRLPVFPDAWKSPDEIGAEYGCIGLFDWSEYEPDEAE